MTVTRRGALGLGAGLAFGGVARAAPPVETPFRVIRNQPWAAVTINGKEPLAFLIDTGSNVFGITPPAATTLGLVPVTTGQVQAAVGRLTTDVYHCKSLVIGGGLRERDVYLVGMSAGRYDFISGIAPIAKFGVMGLDFDRQILSVSRALDGSPEGYEAIETFARGSTFGTTNRLGAYARDEQSVNELDQRPVIQATFDGRPLRLLVDTGASMSLVLEPDFVRRHNLWDAFPASAESAVRTLARTAHVRVVRGGRLAFGRFAFERPIVTLGNPADSNQDGTDDIDGVIGFELIRRLNFLHHPGRKRLYIKPSQALHDVYRYDRAGIEIDAVEGVLRVIWVRPGGPAAAAGLVVGDKVTGWRGKDGYYGLVWALTGAPGTRVEIQIERAGTSSLIGVELQDSV
jgi:predicted aspartyl protease